MSDQNQPTPALGEQPDPQTPEWAQVTDPADADLAGEATEAIPTDHTAVQPEPVDPFAADPMAAVSVDGAADEPAVDQGSSVVPPVPAQPVAAAAAPASPGRSGWSLKKGLLVGAAALGIATLGAAGGAAAVSLAHADGGIGTSQQGGMFDGDRDGDGGFGVCAFAASAAGAPLPDVPRGSPASGHRTLFLARTGETLPHVPAILRAQSPRAPPARA